MSRSKRKTPYITLQQCYRTAADAKRLANRRVRATEDLASGAAFRKVSNSWDICDYKCLMPDNAKAWRK